MKIQVYFDGCCEPVNPGGTMGIGVVVVQDGREVWCHAGICEDTVDQRTSNVAEYAALLSGIAFLETLGIADQEVEFLGDSKLVINQLWGNWKIRAGAYTPLAFRARQELRKFQKVSGRWIPREENARADELSKEELRRRGVEISQW